MSQKQAAAGAAAGGAASDANQEENCFISSDERVADEKYRVKRPTSMLINDNGFIRFRQEGDPDGLSMEYSTDDDDDDAAGKEYLSKRTSSKAVGEMCRGHRCTYSNISAPNTASVSPLATPSSFIGSADDAISSASFFNFKPPSIYLRESIDRALNSDSFARKLREFSDGSCNCSALSVQQSDFGVSRDAVDFSAVDNNTGSKRSRFFHRSNNKWPSSTFQTSRGSVAQQGRSDSGRPSSRGSLVNWSLPNSRYSILEDSGVGANLSYRASLLDKLDTLY